MKWIESCCVLRWSFLVTTWERKAPKSSLFYPIPPSIFALLSLSQSLLSHFALHTILSTPLEWNNEVVSWLVVWVLIDGYLVSVWICIAVIWKIDFACPTKKYLWRVRVEGEAGMRILLIHFFLLLVLHSWWSWQLWLSARGDLSRERQFCYLARSSMFSFDTLILAGISSSADIAMHLLSLENIHYNIDGLSQDEG